MNTVAAPEGYAREGALLRPYAAAAVLLLLSLLIEAAPAQLEMFLTGGLVPVSRAVLKLALILLFGFTSLMRLRDDEQYFPSLLWHGLILFLCADAVFLVAAERLDVSDILLGYNAYYSVLLAAPFAFSLRETVTERFLVRLLLASFLVCAVIGIAQSFTNLPLLYTKSNDGNFAVASFVFFGDVRAFSLFDSGLGFGSFAAFMGALGVALFGRRGGWKIGIPLIATAALASYVTYTRVVYLQLGCACFSAALATFFGRRRAALLPLAYAVLSVVAIVRGAMVSADSNLLSNESLLERLYEWNFYLSKFLAGNPIEQLLGTGLVQNEKFAGYTLPIDNFILAVVLQIGVLGLILVSFLLFFLWKKTSDRAIEAGSPLLIAVAAIWDTFPVIAIYNISIGVFCTLYMLAAIAQPERRIAERPAASASG